MLGYDLRAAVYQGAAVLTRGYDRVGRRFRVTNEGSRYGDNDGKNEPTRSISVLTSFRSVSRIFEAPDVRPLSINPFGTVECN